RPHGPAEARAGRGHHRRPRQDRQDHAGPGAHRLPGYREVELGLQGQARERRLSVIGGTMGTADSAIDLRGIIPATVLPWTQDAETDEPELRRSTRWIADQGIRAVAVNVDTGEGPHLWHEERLRVLRIYKEELAGRGIPIVAGLGASFTAQAVKYAREYKDAGAQCFLVFPITAYLGNPLSSDLPYGHHKPIADETGLPIILFTLQPALGGTDFSDETLLRLTEIPQVIAIKEALFDAKRFREIVNVMRSASRPITILTGNDNFI